MRKVSSLLSMTNSKQNCALEHTGYLTKKGSSYPYNWLKRWFVFDTESRKLRYFTDDKLAVPKGQGYFVVAVFNIPDRTSKFPMRMGGKRQNRIDFQTESGKMIAASADSAEDKERWLAVLKRTMGKIADISKHPQQDTYSPATSPRTHSVSPRPRGDSNTSNWSIGTDLTDVAESAPRILIMKDQWLFHLIMDSWDHGEYRKSSQSSGNLRICISKWVSLIPNFAAAICNLNLYSVSFRGSCVLKLEWG
jgi:hypothetical protein